MARPEKTWEDFPDTTTPLSAEAIMDLESRTFGYTESKANHTIGAQTVADAAALGQLVKMVEIFDANGASLGYLPIYNGNAGTGGGGQTPGDFPSTSVLDAFTRANGAVNVGQSLWLNPIWTTQGIIDVASNAATNGAGSGWEDAYWNVDYGPGVEVFADIGSGAGSFVLWACLWQTGSPSGYAIEVSPGGGTEVDLLKYSNGTPTSLGTFNPTLAAGDSVGFSVYNGVIECYKKTGGTWASTPFMTRTDSTNPYSTGKVGLEIQGTRIVDNFGGGGTVFTGGGGSGTLLFESTFNNPFPDTWSWSYVQANADGDMAYPTSIIEPTWNGATNVAKFEVTTAGLASSPSKKHAKVYKGFTFAGGSFTPADSGELAQINGTYRARFWLPTSYSVPAGQVGSNIFQFKEKMTNQTQNPHTFCYTWNAADVGLNPANGPALYVNNGVNDWQTTRRTQLPLGQWFEIKVVVLRGDSLKWYLNDTLFATVPSSEKVIGAATNLEEWIWGVGNYVETIPNIVYVDRAWKMTS